MSIILLDKKLLCWKTEGGFKNSNSRFILESRYILEIHFDEYFTIFFFISFEWMVEMANFSDFIWQDWFGRCGHFVITAPSNSNRSQLFCLDVLNLCNKLVRFNYVHEFSPSKNREKKKRITLATISFS